VARPDLARQDHLYGVFPAEDGIGVIAPRHDGYDRDAVGDSLPDLEAVVIERDVDSYSSRTASPIFFPSRSTISLRIRASSIRYGVAREDSALHAEVLVG